MTTKDNRIIQSPLELKGLSKYLSFAIHRSIERALWAFCELSIADLMANYQAPITASELSQLNGNNWNDRFLYRLLRVVADADVVKSTHTAEENLDTKMHPEQTVRFRLTEHGLLLTSQHFSKARDMIRLDLGPHAERASTYLPSVIKHGYKHGNSFEQAFGCGIFDYMGKEENKEYATLFNNSLVAYSNDMTSAVVSAIDFSRFNRVVDVAGGLGTLLSSILEKNGNLHGVLFDLAQVVENAKSMHPNEFDRKQIDEHRYEFVAGDMFQAESIPPADAYLLKFIIHDWNDEKATEILRAIRLVNQPQTPKSITVFLVETIVVSNGKDSLEAHVMDLDMLSVVGGRERTLGEYITILNNSGYTMKKLYRTESYMSIIEATTTNQCDE